MLKIVVILMYSVLVASPSSWRAYIDQVTALCMKGSGLTTSSSSVSYISRCAFHNQLYLHCVPYQLVDSQQYKRLAQFTKPCGVISSLQRVTAYWKITVMHAFYIELNFEEFNLSMPHGSCNGLEGSEVLMLGSSTNYSDSDMFFCGRRTPFTLKWRDRTVLLFHMRESYLSLIGTFLCQYNVFERNRTQPLINVIEHRNLTEGETGVSIQLSKLHPSIINPKYSQYDLHIIGDRIKLLSLWYMEYYDPYLHIDAYDGPGPLSAHRHIYYPVHYDGLLFWNFLTFQAYVRITCEVSLCAHLQLLYDFITVISDWISNWEVDIPLSILYPSNHCGTDKFGRSLLYCAYNITVPPDNRVEIALEEVTFDGPDYVGNHPEKDRCLLAGVTIVDSHRLRFFQRDEYSLKDAGNIPHRLVADTILPELTTCYKVHLKTSEEHSQSLPMKTFTSTTSGCIILIYAYANLQNTKVHLCIKPSQCYGVHVGCPILTDDGFVEIAPSGAAYTIADMRHRKLLNCPRDGFFLLYSIVSWQNVIRVLYCTSPTDRKTIATVHSLSAVDNETDCLQIQSNPYYARQYNTAAESGWVCYVLDVDHVDFTPHDYTWNLTTSLSDLFLDNPFGVAKLYQYIYTDNGTALLRKISSTDTVNRRAAAITRCAIEYHPECTNFVLKVEKHCSPMQITSVNTSIWGYQREYVTSPICQQYELSEESTILYSVRVQQAFSLLTILKPTLSRLGTLDRILATLVDHHLGDISLSMRFVVMQPCSSLCQHIQLTIVFEETSMKALVLLRWEVCIHVESQIVVSQLSASGWMVCVQRIIAVNRTFKNSSSSFSGCSVMLKMENQL